MTEPNMMYTWFPLKNINFNISLFLFFLQKLNPSLEATVSRILDQIRNCVENEDRGTNISIGFSEDEEGNPGKMLLKIDSQLAGLPFSWHFIGQSAEKEMVKT